MAIEDFNQALQVLMTDIDDTLTNDGELRAEAYEALWRLKENGIQVVPVTGRPAGWCEMIARFWPVAGVVGENGGFYFRYDAVQKKMIRSFSEPENLIARHRAKLDMIRDEVLREVPGSAVASDQFCRLLDLAIDFCEDVPPLPTSQILRIKEIFEKHGAIAKISSIHVNGWFGQYDKLSKSLEFLRQELRLSESETREVCGFVGDSPNDEPMWSYFKHSFAVANIQNYLGQLRSPPRYILPSPGGEGFVELANRLIAIRLDT